VRYARFITRRPLAVVLIGLTLLLGIAIPATHMNLGLPDDGSKSTATTERKSYDLLTEGFGPGFNGPLTVVVDAPHLSGGEQKDLANKVVAGLKEFPGVAAVSPATQNEAGDLTVVKVTPTTGPASDETKDLVTALRDKAGEIRDQTGIEAFVTGTTALNIDTADTLNAALPKYVAVVVGLALLLLMIVFRSVLVPIKAAVGFLLSIGASMGLVVWVFQDGHLADLLGVAQPGPIVSFLPILLIGILFGLAMDYQIFLVSRMHEAHSHGAPPLEAIRTGFRQAAPVVVAAALIMFSVFAGFVPAGEATIKSIAFALATGILFDAFVVRMVIVPAALALLGPAAWWLPRWLRWLPVLDVEGAALEKAGHAPSPAEPVGAGAR
jgi:RND superfamily putative drug exporter